MHLKNDTSFVMSVNDLESAAIFELLSGRNNKGEAYERIIDLKAGWGRTGRLTPEQLESIGSTVVLIETNSPYLEQRLRDCHKEVIPVDHHLYQGDQSPEIDHRNAKSSLEQIRLLFDLDPDPETKSPLPPYLSLPEPGIDFRNLAEWISANDRGHIPALAEAIGKTPREAKGGNGKTIDQRIAALVKEIRLRDMTLAKEVQEGRDIKELADAGVFARAMEKTDKNFQDAMEHLATAGQSGELVKLCTGRAEDDDPNLILVSAPEEYRHVLIDALYFWKAGKGAPLTQRLQALCLFYNEKKPNLTRVEYYGHSADMDAVREWFYSEVRKKWGTTRLNLYAGGGEGCFFGAEDKLGDGKGALGKLSDGILNCLLTGNRPVAGWRTCFMQPLFFEDSKIFEEVINGLKKETDSDAGSAIKGRLRPVIAGPEERYYFLPHLQETLAPGSKAQKRGLDRLIEKPEDGGVLSSFERRIENLFLTLKSNYPNHPAPYRLRVLGIRLHFFYNRVAVVEWTLGDAATASSEDKNESFWEMLLGSPATGQGEIHPKGPDRLCLAQVLDLNNRLRQCYSTYKDPRGPEAVIKLVRTANGEDKVLGSLEYAGVTNTRRIVGWFRRMVALAMGVEPGLIGPDEGEEGSEKLRLLSDDRARVVGSVVPVGSYPDTPWGRERFEEILARFNTVDPYGQGHFYEPRVALEELNRGLYDRFRSDGSVYACTSHSLVYLGFGSYALNPIHANHMTTMYRRMFLITLFYQAVVHSFSISLLAIEDKREKERTEYKSILKRMRYFYNNLYFKRISSQVQGIELFEKILGRTDIEHEARQTAEDIERTEELIATESRDREEERSRGAEGRRQALYLLGLPLAVFLALSSLAEKTHLPDFWNGLAWWSGAPPWVFHLCHSAFGSWAILLITGIVLKKAKKLKVKVFEYVLLGITLFLLAVTVGGGLIMEEIHPAPGPAAATSSSQAAKTP